MKHYILIIVLAISSCKVFGQETTKRNYITANLGASVDFGSQTDLRLGLGFNNWSNCSGWLCGLTRINHNYLFQYTPSNDAIGFSTNVNYCVLLFGANFNTNYRQEFGKESFGVSPQLGIDIFYASLFVGPTFYLKNDLTSKNVPLTGCVMFTFPIAFETFNNKRKSGLKAWKMHRME